MALFQLHIEHYRVQLKRNGWDLKAIAVVHYPVYQLYAQTQEQKTNHHLRFEKIIRTYFNTVENASLADLSRLLGVPVRVLQSVQRELFSDPDQVLDSSSVTDITEMVRVTRNFLIDAITNRPLPSYFYKYGKSNFMQPDKAVYEEAEALEKRYPSAFRPDLVHTPPTDELTDELIQVTKKKRSDFNIPEGLQQITDVQQLDKLVYPVGVAMSVNKEGEIRKELVDVASHISDKYTRAAMKIFSKQLDERIQGIVVTTPWESQPNWPARFENNWTELPVSDEQSQKHIFRLNRTTLNEIVEGKYGLQFYNPEHFQVNAADLCLLIDKSTFLHSSTRREAVKQNLIRGYDYNLQHGSAKVWLVMFRFETADNFMQDTIELARIIARVQEEKTDVKRILEPFEYRINYVRELLQALQSWDWLEKLDTWQFVGRYDGGRHRWVASRYHQNTTNEQ